MSDPKFYCRAEDLAIGYGKTPLMEHIGLGVGKGTILTLIGPNGAGKSTLLKTLAAQLAPQGGAVLLDGKNLADYSGPERARKMALMVPHTRRTERRCHVIDDQSNIAMVEAGLGISIMPRLLLSQCTANIKIYPIDPEEDRVVGLAVQRPTAMAPAVEQMFHHIVDYCKQMEH